MQGFNGIHVFALPLGSQLEKSEWDKLFNHVPYDDQLRILKYKHWQDRQRALLGTMLVRWSIRHLTDARHIQIARNEYGRPYAIRNDSWRSDFNLSHSGEWIVVALTNEGLVGIDIEKIKPVTEDVMLYAMSQAELAMLRKQPELEQLHLFYEFWTMKEALYKTSLLPNTEPHLLDTIEIKDKYQDIQTQVIYIDKLHPMSICWNSEHSHMNITILNKHQLIHVT
ncbi:4'-phosphopantetheinyl transferase superfamily protein [Lysinibacillus agricola]|uniref:4'-phosphopantetheinyl transferase superfamily protein n=1 Tax=Lysinibacillus agricola TaxID=2590012 RepID=A0ABX7AQ24_9BACI|nr:MULTISPECIES: 4'-phosphopantetheinyl transferase superfamily protein [Lysinibacillus]KOS62276.1 phosphopantetheinyl transferase [Lysinibacillus sp. FJAT-14222]QQP12058.1 4'-phosphopantetheinyl transferase superfamily protein [Lysinibacillus agricola]